LRKGQLLAPDSMGWVIDFDGDVRYVQRQNGVVIEGRLSDPVIWNAWRRAGMRPERLLAG